MSKIDVVNYHGPYMDSSGEKFYLPQKWTLCLTTSSSDGKTRHRYKECSINYSFKPNEMKGSDLMKNLQWLGQFGHLRTLLDSSDEGNDDVCDNNEDEDNLVQQRSGDLIGGGSKQLRKCNNDASYYKFEEERNI